MWAVIIILIIVGMVLLALEIMVVPGVGITGILGFLLMIAGVWMAYTKEGSTSGSITLLAVILISGVGIMLMLRSKTWKKAQLKTFVPGKVRTFNKVALKAGMHGKTITRCAPIGKAVFDNNYVEVDSGTAYLSTGTLVEIDRIDGNKIHIKPINK